MRTWAPSVSLRTMPDTPNSRRIVIVHSDPLVGRQVGDRFRVQAVVARGTSGRVYRAEDTQTGEAVALKVLDSTGGEFDVKSARRRFAQEARTLRGLHHPNTVRIVDAGTWQGVDYIAMEFVEGRTLQAVLEDGPMPIGQALAIARQICGSLREAHSQGIVHRDLKPSNVLLTLHAGDPCFVKVVDFGLVKDLDASGIQATLVGRIVGSPLYMAPEQIRGHEIDARADLYALGGMLFHMVAGQRAFPQDTTAGVLMAHLLTPVPSLIEVGPAQAVPPSLDTLARRMMAKDPDKRMATADAVEDALTFVAGVMAGGRPWAARLPGPGEPRSDRRSRDRRETARPAPSRATQAAPRAPTPPAPGAMPRPAPPRPKPLPQPYLGLLLGAASILLLGVGAGLVLSAQPPTAAVAVAPR